MGKKRRQGPDAAGYRPMSSSCLYRSARGFDGSTTGSLAPDLPGLVALLPVAEAVRLPRSAGSTAVPAAAGHGGLACPLSGAPVPQQPAGQHAPDQAAHVRLPSDVLVRQQHGELVREAQRHDRPDQDVDGMPVEQAADDDVAEVSEHDAAGARTHGAGRLEEPGRKPAGEHDDHGDRGELGYPAVGG